MDLMQLIAFLGPASIATKIYLKNNNKTKEQITLTYINFVTTINLLNFIIVYFVFGHNEMTFTNFFAMKYIILGIINAIVLSILITIIKNNVTFDLEIKRNNKKNEKK